MKLERFRADIIAMKLHRNICVKIREWLDENTNYKFTPENKKMWDRVYMITREFSDKVGVRIEVPVVFNDTTKDIIDVLGLYVDLTREIYLIISDIRDNADLDFVYRDWLRTLELELKEERSAVAKLIHEEKRRRMEAEADAAISRIFFETDNATDLKREACPNE